VYDSGRHPWRGADTVTPPALLERSVCGRGLSPIVRALEQVGRLLGIDVPFDVSAVQIPGAIVIPLLEGGISPCEHLVQLVEVALGGRIDVRTKPLLVTSGLVIREDTLSTVKLGVAIVFL